MKSGFKITVNWNKYQSKLTMQRLNKYLDYLINLRFQGVNRLFYHRKIIHPEQVTKNIFLDSVKLIEYLFSGVTVVSSNPCVEPSPRTKIDIFPIISMC